VIGVDEVRRAVGAICDPELPPLTLADLGILRSVSVEPDDTTVVVVTPTYSGCPAVEVIEADIAQVLQASGCPRWRVERTFQPAWTTDWITAEGHRKLIELGIAPPGPAGADDATGPVPVRLGPTAGRRPLDSPPCPRCGSTATEVLSTFGPTACTSLHRCRTCREPFDHVKAI
jgi:ring-1,2-phenylacetyl-CoA epoxidase subunit PaaD